jgi:tetratricopeptide (TPR) repeat protein
MKCSKCQFENREGARFWNECGHKFQLTCPECGTTNRPGAKFCDDCGHNLTISSGPSLKDLSFDEKLTKIQRYLPKGLTEKILAQKDRIEGERKHVTVMFCDMEGFSALSERLGLEQAYGFMDRIYEILIHKVHDYEGTVNEMTGDGIMALFGAPIALEDAPQRAIRSSLAIHREMAKFSDGIKADRDGTPPRDVGLGYHMGFYYGLFSIVHFNSGDLQNAQLWAEKALKISQKNHEKWAEGFVGTLLGRILGKSGAPHGYSVGYFLLGELYADSGQQDNALENLKRAETMFQEMGMDHWLEKTKEILGRL